MKILVLNGSPRPNGNTVKMIDLFSRGAEASGHKVERVDICKLHIRGCTGCEYCHSGENDTCCQKDDMHIIYEKMKESDMLIIAAPIYYHGISGQMKCAIDRFYSVMYKRKIDCIKKSALFLCSADPDVYEGTIYLYKEEFSGFMKLENMGIFTACYEEFENGDILDRLYNFGKNLSD